MADEPINADISAQLDKRMDRMLDLVEGSENAMAIASSFRTLVEFSKPKPPQVLDLGGVSLTVNRLGEKDPTER